MLSLRSAFVLSLALIIAICAGVLLFYAHHSVPLAVLGAGAAFAGAVTLVNTLVELQRYPTARENHSGFRQVLPAARPRLVARSLLYEQAKAPYRCGSVLAIARASSWRTSVRSVLTDVSRRAAAS